MEIFPSFKLLIKFSLFLFILLNRLIIIKGVLFFILIFYQNRRKYRKISPIMCQKDGKKFENSDILCKLERKHKSVCHAVEGFTPFSERFFRIRSL